MRSALTVGAIYAIKKKDTGEYVKFGTKVAWIGVGGS